MNSLKKIYLVSLVFLGVIISSCATTNDSIIYRVVECPKEIRESAIYYARQYVERENKYGWGGRDYLEKEGVLEIDCSGFVVRSFQYAVKGTKYALLFRDAPVSGFYENFTIPLETPTPGDLIFMGEKLPPTHMSIFISNDGENIYFMDATLKEEDGIDGATLRYYAKDDPRFLSYGRLLLKY